MNKENAKPIYIMLVGLPGVGKSTYIRNVLMNGTHEYVVVSSDAIIEEEAAKRGLTYNDVFSEVCTYAAKESNEIFCEAVKGRKNIIHDRTNLSAKRRKGYLSQIPPDYEKVAVVFYCNPNLHKQQLSNPDRVGKSIPDKVIEDMTRSYTEPTKSEGFDRIITIKK